MTLLDEPSLVGELDAQLLFKEARQRRRRLRLVRSIFVMAVVAALMGIALLLWSGGAPTKSAKPHVRVTPIRPQIAKPATEAVHPVQPGPLAMSPNGDLYIADGSLNEILERSPSGTWSEFQRSSPSNTSA